MLSKGSAFKHLHTYVDLQASSNEYGLEPGKCIMLQLTVIGQSSTHNFYFSMVVYFLKENLLSLFAFLFKPLSQVAQGGVPGPSASLVR